VAQACAEGEATDRTPDALEVRVALRGRDGRETRGLRRAEAVTLTLTVHNPSDQPRALTLPTSLTHDFAISAESGGELWRWSTGRQFAQMLSEVTLAPGASRTFSETWDQVCGDGLPAAVGAYRLDGWIPALAAPLRSEPIEFEID
jgi:hypothetical protein